MGIEIEFVSSDVLRGKAGEEKMDFILKRIKKSKILVLEESLSPIEETKLIELTMSEIDNKFKGIEISTLKEKTEGGIRERLIKMLGGSTGGLTVIGPSQLIRKVKKEPQKMLLLMEKDNKTEAEEDAT